MSSRDQLCIDKERLQVTWKGAVLPRLAPKEWALLKLLTDNPGHVKTRSQVLDAVWGPTPSLRIYDRNVDSMVKRLRRKFKAVDPEFKQIEAIYGFGYAWRE